MFLTQQWRYKVYDNHNRPFLLLTKEFLLFVSVVLNIDLKKKSHNQYLNLKIVLKTGDMIYNISITSGESAKHIWTEFGRIYNCRIFWEIYSPHQEKLSLKEFRIQAICLFSLIKIEKHFSPRSMLSEVYFALILIKAMEVRIREEESSYAQQEQIFYYNFWALFVTA